MNKFSIKFISLFVVVALNASGLLTVGQALAYFSDNDLAGNNVLEAGILDMTVRSGQGNFVSGADDMTPGKQVNRDIYIGKTALSMPLNHKVGFEFISGNIELCNQLDLKIWYDHYFGPPSGGYTNRDMRLTYNGKLPALINYTHSDFEIPHPDDQFDTDPSDGTEQWFYYSIILPSTIADSFQGEVCNFKFIFEAWQTNLPDSSSGFTDKEELESTIKAGYWNPPVVLNEFLPNAGNYPEFIELYNKTASPINLDGFYIKANGNIIPINSTTTSLYSGGSTTIPANGWLVVTAGGDKIDDSSGTVALYNPNDIEVDSYTYGSPDHNVNNTPGWTNNLIGYWPFDNDTQDKSGNGNDGTVYGVSLVSGKINQALSFDGQDDYVSIADKDIFDFGSGEFSVESWVKTTSVLRQWAVTRYEYYGPGWGLGTQNGHALGYIRTAESGTDKKEIEGSVNVSDNNWHHIVMVRTGDKIKLYTDGVFEIEGTLAGNVNDDEPIEVGRISFEGGSQYMSGLIDEVKIYNRALDTSEILEHYNDIGLSGIVPLDKSYARIPDGADNWVDPIPTPGGPNILESEIINQEEAIEEEPIVEEPIAEELPVEETPVAEEEPVSEGEPVIEEELPLEEENPPAEEEPSVTEETEPPVEEEPAEEEVITEENQEQGGIIEEINEIIDEVIDEIVDEIIPDEIINEPTEEAPIEETEAPIIEDVPIIEEVLVDETPGVEEQPVVVPDDSFSNPDGAGESVSDGGSGDGGGDTSGSLDNSNPAEGAGESSGDSGIDAGGEIVSE